MARYKYVLAAMVIAMALHFPAFGNGGNITCDTSPVSSEAAQFIACAVPAQNGLPAQKLSIWVPAGYGKTGAKYPVLYMHDGHNLFNLAHSNFNKIWKVDAAIEGLVVQNIIAPHIVVGIWAPGADRYRQYLPKPIADMASPELRGKIDEMTKGNIISDRYLNWISGDLKQWVDRTFRTKKGAKYTAIAGSSMGGLMSCYAFVTRPDIFGKAACVSTHWPAANPLNLGAADAELKALHHTWFVQKLGKAKGRKLWLDRGTATLDSYYGPYQDAIDAEIDAIGWKRGRDYQSKVYQGAEHEENAWAARLPEILGWLLAK